ncbi:hypothetical protein [Pelomonas sp. Root1217]|uniref:hypothetical protein n=1 Tax=Pelomonas sp. Root1217 TaxID=1736430 RepID=UPI0012FA7B65|nr:hypothetical protein [Pelomonas sp. Root1217]
MVSSRYIDGSSIPEAPAAFRALPHQRCVSNPASVITRVDRIADDKDDARKARQLAAEGRRHLQVLLPGAGPASCQAYFLRGATEIASAAFSAEVAGITGAGAWAFFAFFCSLLPR